jgi:quinol-cytochrome oxidoreductase complex cytochrome b subunit
MGLDIRLPIGGMFIFVGILMTIFGAIRPQSSMSVGINVNLIWGVVLLAFGIFMYLLGRRGARAIRNAPATTAKSEPVVSRGH